GDKPPFSHLVYPCPDHSTGALGIHATIDMAGSVKFGPDAVWVDLSAASVGAVDTSEKKMRQFENSVRRYFPSLGEDCLQADYAGIRPKLVGPSSSGGQKGDVLDLWGRDLSDFVIEGPAQHGGARGLVNLYGIESPGLTSSLRIADYVDSIVSLE
ncbi:L2HGDH, partial [Symbiodinium microadriaticum]